MNCLLTINGIDDFATAGAFGPHARFTASCFILDYRVSISNCLAAERAGATSRLWIIGGHSHESGSSFLGERERVTLFWIWFGR